MNCAKRAARTVNVPKPRAHLELADSLDQLRYSYLFPSVAVYTACYNMRVGEVAVRAGAFGIAQNSVPSHSGGGADRQHRPARAAVCLERRTELARNVLQKLAAQTKSRGRGLASSGTDAASTFRKNVVHCQGSRGPFMILLRV